MHTFIHPPFDDHANEPDIADFVFHDARDVIEFAELGGICCGRARCASWHLDAAGSFVCGTRGQYDDSLDQWADDPSRLIEIAASGLPGQPCGATWVVIDERPTWVVGAEVISEGDVQQFLEFRCKMAQVGVDVVDAVVFDDLGRWWSMCELLTGSTRWGERPMPCVGRGDGVAADRVRSEHEDLATQRTR